jgi:hypothetical protein
MQRWKTRFELKPGKWVYVPTDASRAEGLKIQALLYQIWTIPFYHYHLRNGGHLEAARVHLKNRYFAAFDLKDFFESISASRITRCLKGPLGDVAARNIALASTVLTVERKQKHLPFGFIQSPLIASICLNESSLGLQLSRINALKGVEVSVYMDDVIISSCKKRTLVRVYKLLLSAALKSHLLISQNKLQRPSKGISVFNIELKYCHSQLTKVRNSELLQKALDEENPESIKAILSYIDQANNLPSRSPACL